jgi:hypothetical protein
MISQNLSLQTLNFWTTTSRKDDSKLDYVCSKCKGKGMNFSLTTKLTAAVFVLAGGAAAFYIYQIVDSILRGKEMVKKKFGEAAASVQRGQDKLREGGEVGKKKLEEATLAVRRTKNRFRKGGETFKKIGFRTPSEEADRNHEDENVGRSQEDGERERNHEDKKSKRRHKDN